MTWRRSPTVVWEDDGTTIWAVEPAVGELYALMDTAALVWDWLGDDALESLVGQLAEASGTEAEVIGGDVARYLQELESMRLVIRD